MKRSIVLLWAVSALLVSCGTRDGSSAIPVEDAQSKHFLDEYTGGRTYLMFDDRSLDADVNGIEDVRIDDGKVFVMYRPASNGIFNVVDELSVFDMDGRFLNKIGLRGRGRNEYMSIISWCIDAQNKQVLIVDSDNTIKRYAYDGTYISSVSFDELVPISSVMICGGRLYANMLVPNHVADDIIELKEDGTYVPLMDGREIMQDMGPFEGSLSGIGPTKQLFDPGLESFYHLRVYDDVLYRINDGQVQPCGRFDFIKRVEEDEEEFYFSRELLYSRPLLSIETADKFMIKIREVTDDMVSGYVHYVYDKSTQKCKRYKSGYDRNVGTIINNFDIVGITGDVIITRATPEGARYILENAADKVPQSDLEKLKVLAERENEALIFHHP